MDEQGGVDLFTFMLLVHGYALLGYAHACIEVSAIVAESPQCIDWDGGDEDLEDAFIVDWERRSIRNPARWTVLPNVVEAVATGRVPDPAGRG